MSRHRESTSAAQLCQESMKAEDVYILDILGVILILESHGCPLSMELKKIFWLKGI